MPLRSLLTRHFGVVLTLWAATLASAQPPGFGGRGFGGGRGGPGQRAKLLPQFDKEGKGYLDAAERKAAREYLATQPRRGRFGGGRGFGGGASPPPTPGPSLKPAGVRGYTSEPLYDPQVLRTLFLEFDASDWEKELADFYHTDVDIPAKLTVDGKVYPDVGVHFRGQSSYSTVSEGFKRSLGVSLHFMRPEQRLHGYRSLNLLNSNADPTFLRTAPADGWQPPGRVPNR